MSTGHSNIKDRIKNIPEELLPKARLDIEKNLQWALRRLSETPLSKKDKRGNVGAVFNPCIKSIFNEYNYADIVVRALFCIETQFLCRYKKRKNEDYGFFYYAGTGSPCELNKMLSNSSKAKSISVACGEWDNFVPNKKDRQRILSKIRGHKYLDSKQFNPKRQILIKDVPPSIRIEARAEIKSLLLSAIFTLEENFKKNKKFNKRNLSDRLEIIFEPCIDSIFKDYNYAYLATSLLFFIETEVFLKYRKRVGQKQGTFYFPNGGNSRLWWHELTPLLSSCSRMESIKQACELWDLLDVTNKKSDKILGNIHDHEFLKQEVPKKASKQKNKSLRKRKHTIPPERSPGCSVWTISGGAPGQGRRS